MLELIPYYFLTLMLLYVYGILPFLFFKQALPNNPFTILIIGFPVTGFIGMLCWLITPINSFCFYAIYLVALIIVLLRYPYFSASIKKLFDWIRQQTVFEKVGIALLLVPILYQSAQASKINDMGMYYLQTIKWMHSYGIVKGLANLHPALGLGSAWHSLVVLFDPSATGLAQKWQLNGILVLVFILFHWYESHNSSSIYLKVTFLLTIPLSFLYLTAPSPDLPLLLLSSILFYWVCFKSNNLHTGILLLLGVFLFACKPPAFIGVILTLIIFIKKIPSNKKIQFILAGIILTAPVIYKNYILSGYLLYPYNKPDVVNVKWKVPGDWNEAYRKGIISWGLNDKTDKKTLVQIKYSGKDRLSIWLSRKGYKGIMNKLIFLNFLTGLILLLTEPLRKNKAYLKLPYFLLALLLIISFIEWLMLSQYRLLLPSALVLSGLNCHFLFLRFNFTNRNKIQPLFNTNKIIVYTNILFIMMAFVPFDIFSKESRNKDITQSEGFNKHYLISPFSGFINQKTDSILLGSMYIYYYPEKTYCWDCKMPCVSYSHRNYLLSNFGYRLQPLGSETNDGFMLIFGADTKK